MGRPLWREDGSVFRICCWSLPAQSFSVPSPLGHATIFYCLRFETSLFFASYDSQGHGGGVRPRLHTGQSQSHIATDGRSVGQLVSLSVCLCRAPSGAHDQTFITLWQLRSYFLWGALSDERTGLICTCCWPLPEQPFSGPSPLVLATIFYCLRFKTSLFVASYDSLCHGGGIRTRLHAGLLT
jgi:hypothetical protein